MMNEDFNRSRITELRMKKNVSEYKMSLNMGHSRSYIQSIVSGRTMPSISEFLYICEYLGVSPRSFFDVEEVNPILVQKALAGMKQMNDKDLLILLNLIDRFNEK